MVCFKLFSMNLYLRGANKVDDLTVGQIHDDKKW